MQSTSSTQVPLPQWITRHPYRLGGLLIVLGLAANHWIIGLLVAPDYAIEEPSRIVVIGFFQIVCLVAGFSLAHPYLHAWWASSVKGLVGFLGSIFVLSLSITVLWWGVWSYITAHNHTVEEGDTREPTSEEIAWAKDAQARALAIALERGWFDFETAKSQGFVPMFGDETHFVNREYLFDDKILDLERPEFLMYEDLPEGKILTGLMFLTRSLYEVGPKPAGPIALWHYHPWVDPYCLENGLLPISRPDSEGLCKAGMISYQSAEMLHLWIMETRLGPYSDAMWVPGKETGFHASELHPVVVHFAIALFFIAVLLDALARILRREILAKCAWINLIAAGVFAVVTVGAGMWAETQLLISDKTHEILDVHKSLAFSFMALLLALIVWRWRNAGRIPSRGKATYVVLTVIGLAMLSGVGYLGGSMVYGEGLAVKAIDRVLLDRHVKRVVTEYQPAARAAQRPASD